MTNSSEARGPEPVGYKWVFVRKRDETGVVVRYKARLVAQGFSQIPGIDYDETYSPVMDAITFRYLLLMSVVGNELNMRLMDVVTAYLYGKLDTVIYMKLPEGYKLTEAYKSKIREDYVIFLDKSLYGSVQVENKNNKPPRVPLIEWSTSDGTVNRDGLCAKFHPIHCGYCSLSFLKSLVFNQSIPQKDQKSQE